MKDGHVQTPQVSRICQVCGPLPLAEKPPGGKTSGGSFVCGGLLPFDKLRTGGANSASRNDTWGEIQQLSREIGVNVG